MGRRMGKRTAILGIICLICVGLLVLDRMPAGKLAGADRGTSGPGEEALVFLERSGVLSPREVALVRASGAYEAAETPEARVAALDRVIAALGPVPSDTTSRVGHGVDGMLAYGRRSFARAELGDDAGAHADAEVCRAFLQSLRPGEAVSVEDALATVRRFDAAGDPPE